MATTLGTAARNAACDAVVDLVDAGSANPQGTLEILDGVSVLVSHDLANPAFGASVAGVATLLGVPISSTASGTGTADGMQFKDRDGNVLWTGSVTATGGGGDVELDNTSIVTGQTVKIVSHTHTQPAS